MKICFIDKTEFKYDYKDINNKKLRGAENILINFSTEICKLGHEVVVFNNCVNEYRFTNFSWLNISRIKSNNYNFDVVISNNDTNLLDNIYAKKKFVISHSLQTFEKFIRKRQIISYIKNKPVYLLLGNYHKLKMSKLFSLYGTKIINYGLDKNFLETKLTNNIDNNLSMFTSRPDRNLNILLDVWKKYIYLKNKTYKLYITPINKNLRNYNIFNRNLVDKNTYISQIIKSRLMIIPGHKAELYCLAASEASELCIPIVTMGIGALSERVQHEKTGLIAKNIKQFGDYILEIYSNNELWTDIRNNLKTLRGNKNWSYETKKFLDVLEINE
ncbi:MAG: glycosyltransferase family 1 protein [Flavobacteriales bacterium TMED235]|nr:MAG: glycosyltransferase family 1 protein [Flavobacteriales bacterium TMED235]